MQKQRLVVPFVLACATAGSSGLAGAAVPPGLLCSDAKTVDCFLDEIFILDGNNTFDTIPTTSNVVVKEPIVTGCTVEMVGGMPRPVCTGLLYERALALVLDRLTKGGLTATWDTIAIFGADFPRKVDGSGGGEGPAFIRRNRANDIDGIGLPVSRRRDPFVGYIAGGSTTNFGTFATPLAPPPKGLAAWPEPDPAGVEGYAESYPECDGDSICFDGFHNGYQALAAAVGQMYGPYVDKGWDDRVLRKRLPSETGPPPQRSGLVQIPAFKGVPGARVWNSLLSFDASLMGGNRWRNNGDGTYETTSPSPFWAASPPYQGKPLSRFNTLELYLMGLVPAQALTPVGDFTKAMMVESLPDELQRRFGRTFALDSFGQIPFVPIVVRDAVAGGGETFTESDRTFDPAASLLPVFGQRDPEFGQAPHNHRQLWVVVTKPNDPENTQKHIQYMLKWRRAWNAYYYMLTGYHGRMITTADASEDDSPYWEFAQAVDEQQTFTPVGGLQVQFPGPRPEPGSQVIASFARVSTPGATAGLQFTPHANQPPMRLKTNQTHPGAMNTLAVRMRVPLGTANQAVARVELGPGVSVQLPSHPGSFLIADGKWHTYSANLTAVPGYVGQDFTGFTFIPSTEAASEIDVEFIRFGSVDAADLGDRDTACDGSPMPDGFIDSEDNCPRHHNPLQQDTDGNGTGDACEDLDQDGTANLCDNCPTLSNSRQRDRDGDSVGDACDGDPGGGCFLQPESVAGSRVPHSFGWLSLMGLALGAAGVRRRRRRKQDHQQRS